MNNLKMNVKIFRINMTTEDETRDTEHLNEFLENNAIVSIKEEFRSGKVDRWLIFVTYYKMVGNITSEKIKDEDEVIYKKINKPETTEDNEYKNTTEETINLELKNEFTTWRKKRSLEEGVPLYRIITNSAIDELIKNQPDQVGKLHMLKGIGMVTQEKFGAEIIGIISKFKKESK